MPGKRVKPFVGGNKNDAADTRAIWTAVQQPGIKTVAVKSEAQQPPGRGDKQQLAPMVQTLGVLNIDLGA